MSARRIASSVFCAPLPTHLDQPPLIPKRIKAARASTTTGINFLNHPLLSDTFSLGGGVVVSDDGFVSSALVAVVPLLFDVVSTAAAAGFVSAIFTCPLPEPFQTPPSLSRTRAMPVGIRDSLQPAMPETEGRLKAKQ